MGSIDEANIAFWNELCGSHLAAQLGVTDASPSSLKRFDNWFFDFYPYLFEHVRLADLARRDVLEVGLGYGSLSQRIAESGAQYTGLDIAPGPVEMARHRLSQAGMTGDIRQGSILAAPFSDASFDYVVTIGCLHHTGNMGQGISESWRVLRAGGTLVGMVYYAYSYRRWRQARSETLRYLIAEIKGYRGVVEPPPDDQKWDYDHNTAGEAAPHTDFVSVKSLRYLCRRFSDFRWQRRNINQEPPFSRRSREELLDTWWPRLCGLEVYFAATK
jgi:SAM-dependent methyltransferase